MTLRDNAIAKLNALPEELVGEVDQFIDFLNFRHGRLSRGNCGILRPPGEENLGMPLEDYHRTIAIRARVYEVAIAYTSQTEDGRSTARELYAVYVRCMAGTLLDLRGFYDILIELSSPFVRYLGRDDTGDWEYDRFWVLRPWDQRPGP